MAVSLLQFHDRFRSKGFKEKQICFDTLYHKLEAKFSFPMLASNSIYLFPVNREVILNPHLGALEEKVDR